MIMLPWPELEVPLYTEASYAHWELKLRDNKNPRSYWCREAEDAFKVFTLSKWNKGEDRTTWMSVTQFELESHMPHVAAAHGHVAIAGLGMGVYLYNVLQKPEVTRVSVFEIEKPVIDLMSKAGMWEWRGAWKIDMYNTDVLDLRRTTVLNDQGTLVEPVDFLYVDIWPKIGLDHAVTDVTTMQRTLRAKSVGWWGQEYDFMVWCKKQDRNLMPSSSYSSINMDAFMDWRKAIQLPVTGYQWSDYPTLCAEAISFVPITVAPIKGKKP